MNQDESEIFELIAGDSPSLQRGKLDKAKSVSHENYIRSPLDSPTSHNASMNGEQVPAGGWYGWMASWFGKGKHFSMGVGLLERVGISEDPQYALMRSIYGLNNAVHILSTYGQYCGCIAGWMHHDQRDQRSVTK
uniref:Uncharacterized protein n=1 Tax=Ditylenchus dipsaci TaxID=166011 RepID=A0A915ETX5_9BILA